MQERYHWRSDNQVELLIDGEQFFPAMLQAIESARSSVLLEFYMVSSGIIADQFISALTDAAMRGVQVCWLVDDFGARRLRDSDISALRTAGVKLHRYNRLRILKLQKNFARDHRKLLLVDQQQGFIGGTGISDEYGADRNDAEQAAWHEVMVRVTGPVVNDLLVMFTRQWCRYEPGFSLPDAVACGYPGTGLAKVSVVKGLQQQDIKLSFVRHVREVQQRVWLATAYFLPSFSVRRSLRQAAQRGVDVRIIVAGPCTDHRWIYYASKRYYRRLLRAGVRIYEYQPSFLHTKIGICDNWVSVGSCNLDHWNLRWNLEANLEVVEPGLCSDVEALLLSDMERCQEVTYEQWQKRPLKQKAREVLWSLICQLLLKIR